MHDPVPERTLDWPVSFGAFNVLIRPHQESSVPSRPGYSPMLAGIPFNISFAPSIVIPNGGTTKDRLALHAGITC